MTKPVAIHWFRQDLRLADNPSLTEAVNTGSLLPIFILDDDNAARDKIGAARRWWLHHSLTALNEQLNGKLLVFKGDAHHVLNEIITTLDIDAVHWNRCYEPWRIARDAQIKQSLKEQGVATHSHNGSLLWEPWQISKKDGTPYKVFTPFYRRGCLEASAPKLPIEAPANIADALDHALAHQSKELKNKLTHSQLTINELELLPKIPWDKQLEPHWQINEHGAQRSLERFIDNGINDYKEGRNFPAKENVSRLSPYLHSGEISPNQIWYAVKANGDSHNHDHLLSELGWREFAYSQLYHFPTLPRANLNKKFDRFPWSTNPSALTRWQQGQTGYPIVDAGMRELWQTGYMHNRVRMVVASFLVKNLQVHWHDGQEWFWDCLVDADLANNSAAWQWVAGCGTDAAPYFRIFNPITQGEKFDPSGDYTKRFVPELAKLPKKYLYKPWTAPQDVLDEAGVTLGDNYPLPIVDVAESRKQALAAYQALAEN